MLPARIEKERNRMRRWIGLGSALAVLLCILVGCAAEKPLVPAAGMQKVTLIAEGMH